VEAGRDEELERPLGSLPPWGVVLSAGLLFTQFALTFEWWLYLARIWRHMAPGFQGVSFIQLAWSLLVGTVLPISLVGHRRWAWSAAVATLLVATARGLANAAVHLTGGGFVSTRPMAPRFATEAVLSMVWFKLPWVFGAALILWLLTRSHSWFGIERRQVCSTLVREGGWALLLATTVLFGSWALLWLDVL
jgi:hypothetical protein